MVLNQRHRSDPLKQKGLVDPFSRPDLAMEVTHCPQLDRSLLMIVKERKLGKKKDVPSTLSRWAC